MIYTAKAVANPKTADVRNGCGGLVLRAESSTDRDFLARLFRHMSGVAFDEDVQRILDAPTPRPFDLSRAEVLIRERSGESVTWERR